MIRTRSEDLFVELTPGAMMHQALAFSRTASGRDRPRAFFIPRIMGYIAYSE